MILLPLIIAVMLFIIADFVIRIFLRKNNESRIRKQREDVLSLNLNLDFTHESKTLKRVEVEDPKAKILAVDDEEIVLDSFRKILVLDGYSVDTVQTGQEAIGLVQKYHYDFCFTDLKMPEMDGIELTKSVKYLRPDIDVIVITGFATVESAVDTMKFGAMDYIQKPFSEDELIELTAKSLIKRQDKIQKQFLPKVEITHVYKSDYTENSKFFIPGGVFISENHVWLTIEQDGSVKIGMDDFAEKFLENTSIIDYPTIGLMVKERQALFCIKHNNRSITFKAPLNGRVIKLNKILSNNPENLKITPYEDNWICILETDDLECDLQKMKIGKSAVSFYYEDIHELHNILKEYQVKQLKLPSAYKSTSDVLNSMSDKEWQKIVNRFF